MTIVPRRLLDRSSLLERVSERLGTRRLVWFGTRGDDIESLTDLEQLSSSFSIINRYRHRATVEGVSLEELTGVRVDLDTFDIDADTESSAFREFRRELLRTLSRSTAVITYRPSRVLSAACFARHRTCRYLGMFNDHQSAFEHKPWVESEIARLGVPCIEWHYVSDDDQLQTLKFLDKGPVILRRSRTNGGVGVMRIDDPSALREQWPSEIEAFVSVAPYIEDGLPLNVNGVVWGNGITVHPASVQLIGIPECTARPFGYCGNDFAAAATLDEALLAEVESTVRTVGKWLGDHGYLGAFGVDLLVDKSGRPLFTEVNPRMQGSTHASAELSVNWGQSCVPLEHLAAFLGIDAPAGPSLVDFARARPQLAHFIVHSNLDSGSGVDPGSLVEHLFACPGMRRIDVLTRPHLTTERGATVARVTTSGLLTTTGFELLEPWATTVREWGRRQYSVVAQPLR